MNKRESMSSNIFPSTGGKPKFNPNAEFEVVQEERVATGKKPKFNPKASFEAVTEEKVVEPTTAAPKSAFQLSQPTFKSAPVPGGARDFSFEKPADELGVAKLAGSAQVAQEKLKKELNANDALYEKKLREYRKDSYTVEQLREDYKKNGWFLSPSDEQKILQKEKQKRYDAPITPTDISDFKTGTILNDSGARKFIKDLNKSDVQADLHLVDKYNEVANAPNANERIEKIKDVNKRIRKGEVVYDPEKKIAIKPLGVIGSVIEGTMNKLKLEDKHDFFKNTENDAAIIKYLEDQRNNPDTDEPVRVPKGKAQEFLMMASEMPLTPILAGLVGSLAGPEGAMAAGGAVGAYENRKIQYTTTFEQVYNELRDQGVNTFEALQEAKKQADHAQEIGTIVGAAQGVVGAKMASVPLKSASFSTGYQQAIGNLLKKNGYELGKVLLEGAAQGGIGALGEVAKNKLAQSIGIDRELDAGTADQFWGNVMMAGGIAVGIKAGRGLSKLDYKRVLHGLSKLPEEQIGGALQEKVQSGEITQEAADQTIQRINDYKALDQLIPDNVTEEARFKIQDKITKRNELEQKLETTDKAYHPEIKEKIKAIDEEIVALSKETEKPPKTESGLTKSQEKEAIETAEEFLSEGIFPEIYAQEIQRDPIGFWKTIAQQAQNRDEQWRPLKEPLEESVVREQFGDTVVDYAKELFPAPDLPASTENVSVIMPGEIKQPETITIKPKEDAIPERSPEAIHVDETPRDSETVVGGIPESGETAIPQEGQPEVQKESHAEGQEKVAIHAERPPTQLSFRGLQDTANEFGFEDVKSRDRKSDLQTRVNAEKTANEWAAKGEYEKNIDDLLGKIERREMVATDEQRLILEQYLANEKQIARELSKSSPEYDRQIAKIKRIKEIGNSARSEAAAALRIPDGGSRAHPITDEVDAMAAKMEANSVDKLTDQQKAEVEAQVAKYKKAAEEANEKVAKLEEQIAKVDAEKEFKKAKSTAKRTKKTAEERVAYRKSEIEAAREALKKLRTGESGLSAVPLPGVRELMAIAPHVKNIMVDLVEQGVVELADAVKQLHEQFKDVLEGITEKDIHNIIAGEYNKPQKTKSQLQRQLEDLKYEAKLINQLEALQNGMEPKSEKGKRERNQKIKALRDKIKDFRKQKSTEEKDADSFYKEEFDDDVKSLIAIKKRNEKKAAEIKEKIAKAEFEKDVKKSIFDREDIKKKYPKLRKEALDAIAKKEDAQHEFDLALFKDEMAKRNWVHKSADFSGKVLHTSKAVLSGIDDSATFVQNGLAMLANPRIGLKVWLRHWREAFNDAQFKRELAALHARSDWEVIKKSGLEIVEPHSAASKQVEEAFEKNLLAGKIKIKGKEFQPWKYTGGIFERAFTSMGNNMRLALFEKRMGYLKDEGKTFESHPEEYKAAARAINELTGRGKLPEGLAMASPYITPFIWAPRMLTSTVNTLGLSDLVLSPWKKGYYQNLTPTQRKFALYQLGRGIAVGVGVMGAAAFGGATVDFDPRSVTFGDIIIGNHHYNVFGRYVPVVKTLVQASLGTRIKKGKVQDLDSGKFGAKTRGGVIGGFFRAKVTPAVGAGLNLLEGRDYFTQKPFGAEDLPKELLMPMSIDDLIEGWEHDGTAALLTRFLPAFEGIKVSDERDFQKKDKGGSGGGGATKTIKKGLNKSLKKELKK
jgi:hypothetical protein